MSALHGRFREISIQKYLDTDVPAIREKLEQAQTTTYEIYQLKDSPDRRDYAFAPLGRLHEQERTVDMQNYDKVYSTALRPGENLESIYTRFNIDHPQDFTGHLLSVSDVVVLHQNGQDTAHYCDSFGFTEVPEYFAAGQLPAECRNGYGR